MHPPLLLVVLVVYVADEFLDDVLHRNETRGPAVLVHDDGRLRLLVAQQREQVVDGHGFRHERRFLDRAGDRLLRLALAQQAEQVLDVGDAAHIVEAFVIHGET